MKKLITISMLALLAGCSKQIGFSKLLPQAFNEPVSFIDNITDTINLNSILPLLGDIDSVTCNNARVGYIDASLKSFVLESDLSNPFYVIKIWHDGDQLSLLGVNNDVNHSDNLFITSDLDNRERITIKSNADVEQWQVFWQNIEIPLSSLEISANTVVVPVPENAFNMDKSEIRVIAFAGGSISNSTTVRLIHDKVFTNLSKEVILRDDSDDILNMLPMDLLSDSQMVIFQNLLTSRAEWHLGDAIQIIDDSELMVCARTYMGETSFFALNKSAYPVERRLHIPRNIKMGNLKTYFDQSIKQTGENIVINLCPNSYEIATSEIL